MQDIHADFNQPIENIDVKIEVADVIIKTGDRFSVDITGALTDSFKVIDVMDKTFTIVQKINKWRHPIEFIANRSPKVVITLPKDFYANKATFYLDVGQMTATAIKSKAIKVNASVGQFNGIQIISETAEIRGNVGNIKLIDCSFKNCTVTSSTGDIVVDSYFKGEADIKTSVGAVKINIKDNIEDYYITATTSVGSSSYNGMKISGPIGTRSAANAINVSTSVGEIKIISEG